MALNPEAQRVQNLMASFGSRPGNIQDLVSPEDYFLLQKHGFASTVLPAGAANPWETGGGGSEAMGKLLTDQRAATNGMAIPPAPTPTSTTPTNNTGRRTVDPIPAAPPNPWQTQPKPGGQGSVESFRPAVIAPYGSWPGRDQGVSYEDYIRSQTQGGGSGGPPLGAARYGASGGGLPPGFDIRAGSQDPAINQQVYGTNYFPGNLPGFEGITNSQQFFALSPQQQGDYREALYRANQGGGDPRARRAPVEDAATGMLPRGTQVGGIGGYNPGGGGTAPPGGGGAPPPETTPPGGGTRGMDYPGGRGNYMGYGSNAGGLRLDPNYLPETWDYRESPEYLNRLKWAQRDLNRQLLQMGRSDSTGGINAMARQQSEMAGQEIDKQYQRALQANMENYGRYFGANQANYGRTVGEDQTGWNRAAYLGEQDWLHNWQLANMGLDATKTGVSSGNQTGMALAELLNQNGATQASLALRSGAIDADTIQALLNAGLTYAQINGLFKTSSSGATSGTGGSTTTSGGGGGEAGDIWG